MANKSPIEAEVGVRHRGDKTPDSTEPQTERTGEEEREFEAEETEDRESLLSTIGEPGKRITDGALIKRVAAPKLLATPLQPI